MTNQQAPLLGFERRKRPNLINTFYKNMRKEDLLWIIIFAGLIIGGVLQQGRIRDLLSKMQAGLLPVKTEFEQIVSELETIDIADITLPEIVEEEETLEEATLGLTPEVSLDAPGVNSSTSGAEEKKMSLKEIQDQVNVISVKTAIISLKVAKLALASEKPSPEQTEQAGLVNIQEQINQISEQIQLLSQEIS